MPSVPTLDSRKTINCDFCQFKILKLLGKGGFGAVYLVEETVKKSKYAVKTELMPGKNDRFTPRLLWEETILLEIQALPDENQKKHFIKVIDRGELPSLRFMLMSLVGKSLHDLLVKQKNKQFSKNTCWKIAEQTLEALEAFHNAGFVHRDIKPHNYTIGGPGQENIIFMLDFGLVRCYTGKVYTHGIKDKPSFAGTIKYCSRSSHFSVYQYPKDDFECWIFSLMEFHNSQSLYWGRTDDMDVIRRMKMNLFAGKEPSEIFNRLVPSQYRSLIKMINKLTPIDMIKKPDKVMRQKVPCGPFYNKLYDIKDKYKLCREELFDWQKK